MQALCGGQRGLDGRDRADAVDGGGVFAPVQDSPDQFVTNIFFLCNYMHDFFMMLGFTEESGNFQTTNVTGTGRGADPVRRDLLLLRLPDYLPGG